MIRVTEDLIKRAKSPWEIYSRDPTSMARERDEYLERFKPAEYKTIEYYVIKQNIILLYEQGMAELNGDSFGELVVYDVDGNRFKFVYQHIQEQRIGKMLTTKDHVILVVYGDYRKFYENYISKTSFERHVSRDLWAEVKYYLPNVIKSFETADGNFVIIVRKPHSQVYPLANILEYFDGRMDPKYVASIMTRLYMVAIYCNLRGVSHNAITVENIFFSPGRYVPPGEPFSIEDVRIVGVYGGWFFTTNNARNITGLANEQIMGLPAKIKSIIPEEVRRYQYGSYKIDMLAIKQVGRELLGDITGKDLGDIPKPFAEWLNSTYVHPNAYKEFEAWELVRDGSFDKHVFVEMSLS